MQQQLSWRSRGPGATSCSYAPAPVRPVRPRLAATNSRAVLRPTSPCVRPSSGDLCSARVQKPRRWVAIRASSNASDQPGAAQTAAVSTKVNFEVKPEDSSSSLEFNEETNTVRVPLAMVGDVASRRTKLVIFTCNKCGGRTARNVNPVAWEKGVVFGQCSHCNIWHTLSAKNKLIYEEIRFNAEEGFDGISSDGSYARANGGGSGGDSSSSSSSDDGGGNSSDGVTGSR